MDLSEQVGHYDYLLLANEESGHRHELGSFHLFLQELSAVEEPVKVLMVFGSEGGFDSSEVELLERRGLFPMASVQEFCEQKLHLFIFKCHQCRY